MQQAKKGRGPEVVEWKMDGWIADMTTEILQGETYVHGY